MPKSVSKKILRNLVFALMFAVWVLTISLPNNAEADVVVTTVEEQELAYWYEFSSKHPTYRDAHFIIASLEKRMGHTERALEAYQVAVELDVSRVLGAYSPF